MGSPRQVVIRVTVPQSLPTMTHLTIFVILLNILLATTFPAGEELELDTKKEETREKEDTEEKEGGVDLLELGASALNGLLGLIGAKIDFLRSLLKNKDLHEQLGKTVEAGVNVTRGIVAAKIGAVKSTAELIPRVIEAKQSILEASSRGSSDLVSQGRTLVGSVVKAANNTAPLVADIVQETVEQIPLVTRFASAYAEVNAEQASKVARTFYGSLQCDLQCGELTDLELKEECEIQFCQDIETDASYYDDDYYDE